MKIRIKRRSQAEWLIIYIFALPFAFSFLMDLLHIPGLIKYTIDLALVMLVFILYLNRKFVEDSHVTAIMRTVAAFVLVTIVGLVLEYQSVIYYLWGMRNNLRFFVYFWLCTAVIKQEDSDSCIRLMDGLFYINLVVTLFQYFVLDVHQDRLGGIFGSSRGCNAYTNIYLLILVSWHMLRYMNHQETFMQSMPLCGISLMIATLAELKMFLFEFAIIAVLATMMTKFSVRKLWIIIGTAIGLVVSVDIIKMLFPFFADWFSLDVIFEHASSEKGYTNTNDINRLSALSISWNRFLKTWPRKMFGLGLGNCDYSSNFAFLTTPFYQRYGHLNYIWFSSSFLMLETGLLGLLTYFWFFASVYREAKKLEKQEKQNPVYCQIAKIMAVMASILVIYNSSLRMECAYMLFFVLAMPFMKEKKNCRPLIKTRGGI